MLIPPSITFTGNKQMAISLKSRAIKFYNFIANQAEIGGVSYISRSLPLEDGSFIKITSYKEGNYNLRTGNIVIFGKSNIISKLKKKIQVCWYTGIGSEFISSTGIRTQKNDYQSANPGTSIISGYWVNKEFTDAVSWEGVHLYYKGKGYSGDEDFNALDVYEVRAMYLKGALVLLYKTFSSNDYFIAKGALTPAGISVDVNPVNISAEGNEINFASFGGDDLLWTLSRNVTSGVADTTTFIRCYKVSINTEGLFEPVMVAESSLDCTLYGTETNMENYQVDSLIVGGINVSGTVSIVQDYKRLNVVQDIFIQGNSLSLGVKSVSGNDSFNTNYAGTVALNSQATNISYFFVGSSIDITYDVDGITYNSLVRLGTYINPISTDGSTICSKDITAHRYDLTANGLGGYTLNNTTPFTESPPDINVSSSDQTTDREDLNFQYADGINNQYAVFHEDIRGSTLYRQVIVTGDNGTITDLDTQTLTVTHPTQSFWTAPGVVRNSNSSELSSNQGYIGSFDNKTYLLQTLSTIQPYYDHFAFSKGNILLREKGDYRSLTVGTL